MTLAIFDLDHTLLHGDSDQLWGEFFARRANLDEEQRIRTSQRFYDDYVKGKLDLEAFLEFALAPLSQFPMAQLIQWRNEFIQSVIDPIILPAAVDLIEEHRSRGDTPIIITATNHFLTEPIAGLFGVKHLLATQPEIRNGQFTGRYTGVPTFREGKVVVLNMWIKEHNESLSGSYFYSDSANDIPLLDLVDHPIAVDPDPTLRLYAEERNWQVISLRNPE